MDRVPRAGLRLVGHATAPLLGDTFLAEVRAGLSRAAALAPVEVLLRRPGQPALPVDHQAARLLPDAGRAGDPRAARRGHRRAAPRTALHRRRPRRRRRAQDPAAAPAAGAGRARRDLCPGRPLPGGPRRRGRPRPRRAARPAGPSRCGPPTRGRCGCSRARRRPGPRLVLFLGSSIGNFEHAAARALLRELRRALASRRPPAGRLRSRQAVAAAPARLRRRPGRDPRLQPQPAGAHQPRARRRLRPLGVPARRHLGPGAAGHGELARVHPRPGGPDWRAASSSSRPASGSTPRSPASTPTRRSRPSRADAGFSEVGRYSDPEPVVRRRALEGRTGERRPPRPGGSGVLVDAEDVALRIPEPGRPLARPGRRRRRGS